MPILQTALRDQDLGFLRIVSGFWGISLQSLDSQTALEELATGMLDADLVDEIVAALPADLLRALAALVQYTGRMPWVRFTQQFGAFRQMGPARRDRDRPHENPASPVEALVYRGLVARAFFNTADGPQEFAYIPDDLLPLVPRLTPALETPPGRPAADKEHTRVLPVNDHILDDATTILAALRMGRELPGESNSGYRGFLLALMRAGGLIDAGGDLEVEAVRILLEMERGQALAWLTQTWLESASLDDLRLIPSIEAEGEWTHEPLRTRRRILDFLASIPARTWWSLPGFIAAIKGQQPDFQRPDGDFDSWYLKSRQDGTYLRGVDSWDAVEGALLRWLIAGPLHWLGMVDLAHPAGSIPDPPATAFRISRWSAALLAGRPPTGTGVEDRHVHVRSDGRINVPRLVPRAVRYLLARFCEWEPEVTDEYRYRPTPSSLLRAADQGLHVGQLITLLARHAEGIPPNVTLSLKNWQNQGQAARIQTYPVLRLPSSEALDALRSSRGARFLGDILGPAAVELKPGTEKRVLAVLSEQGYLGEIIDK